MADRVIVDFRKGNRSALPGNDKPAAVPTLKPQDRVLVDFRGSRPQQAPEPVQTKPEEDIGFFDRMGRLVKQGYESYIAGQARNYAAQTAEAPIRMPWQSDEDYAARVAANRRASQEYTQIAREKEAKAAIPIPGTTSWEDVKAKPGVGTVGAFALETLASSTPETLQTLVNPVDAFDTFTGRIGQTRAVNDQRQQANIGDIAEAVPYAVGAMLMERLGAGNILKSAKDGFVKGTIKSSAGEGATEFGQEVVEYAGGTVGTKRGFNTQEALDQGLAGLVAGAGGGIILSTGAQTSKSLLKRAMPSRKDDIIADEETTGEATGRQLDQRPDQDVEDTSLPLTDETKAPEELLPSQQVLELYNEDNIATALANGGPVTKNLRATAATLRKKLVAGNDGVLNSWLKQQARKVDPDIFSPEQVAQNQAMLDGINDVVNMFRTDLQDALDLEERLTGPGPIPGYVADKNRQELDRISAFRETQEQTRLALQEQQKIAEQQALAEREAAFQAAQQRVQQIHRKGFLDAVLKNPDVTNPMARFTSLLEQNGFDGQVTPEELEALQKAQDTIEQQTATEAANSGMSVEQYKQQASRRDAQEADKLGMALPQYMELKARADGMGLSVAAYKQMLDQQTAEDQRRQQAKVPQAKEPTVQDMVDAPLTAKGPQRPATNFALEQQAELTDEDRAKMAKAEAKRERKAEQPAPADENQLDFLGTNREGKPQVRREYRQTKAEMQRAERKAERAKKAEAEKGQAVKGAEHSYELDPGEDSTTVTINRLDKVDGKARFVEVEQFEAPRKDAVRRAKKRVKELNDAAQKGQVAEGGKRERKGTDGERTPAEAGRGDSAEQGGTQQKTEAVKKERKKTQRQIDAEKRREAKRKEDEEAAAKAQAERQRVEDERRARIEASQKAKADDRARDELAARAIAALSKKQISRDQHTTLKTLLQNKADPKVIEQAMADAIEQHKIDKETAVEEKEAAAPRKAPQKEVPLRETAKYKKYQQSIRDAGFRGRDLIMALAELNKGNFDKVDEILNGESVADRTRIRNDQEITRRNFLNGVAATAVAAVAAKPNPVYAKTRTPGLEQVLEGATPEQAVTKTLQWIADNAPNPFYRRIAKKLMKNGMGKTQLYIADSYADGLYGDTTLEDNGDSTVVLYTPQGINLETALHELIHAYVQQRWGGLSIYLQSNKKLLGDSVDRSDKLVRQFQDLWNGLQVALETNDVVQNADWSNALSSASELLSWVLTNSDVQAFMRTINEKGQKVSTPKNSLWESFRKFIMELFGMKYTPTEMTALDKILTMGEQLIDAGATVKTGDFNVKIAQGIAKQSGRAVTENMYIGQTSTQMQEDPKVRASFVTAQLREANGEDVGRTSDVRKETGWFKAADGEWRYEINDAGAKFKGLAWKFMPPGVTMRLGDVFHHPSLFEHYPQLADIKVMKTMQPLGGGFYDDDAKLIGIGLLDTWSVESVLTTLHELQHGIQSIEGFGAGANTSDYPVSQSALQKLVNVMSDRLENRKDVTWMNPITKVQDIRWRKKTLDALKLAKDILDDPVHRKFEEAKQEQAALNEQYAEAAAPFIAAKDANGINKVADSFKDRLDAVSKKVEDARKESINTYRSALKNDRVRMVLYMLTHGEIEARDTEIRFYAGMTDEQRQQVPPMSSDLVGKVGVQNAIIIPQGGGLAQSKPLKGKKFEDAAEESVSRLPDVARRTSLKSINWFRNGWKKLQTAQATENIIADAVEKGLIPSAKEYLRIVYAKKRVAREYTDPANNVRQEFMMLSLGQQGLKGPVNQYILNSQYGNKWGYKPAWNDAVTDKDIDPDMAKEWAKLTSEERSIVDKVFEQGYRQAEGLSEAWWDSINTVYDELVAKAKGKPREEQVIERLEKERELALKQPLENLEKRRKMPYVTMRRTGDYVVIAKSQDMLTAEELGDTKLINEFKVDPNHLIVASFDSELDADEYAAQLTKTGKFVRPVSVPASAAADNLNGGRDMIAAINKLRDMIENHVDGVPVGEDATKSQKRQAEAINFMKRMATDMLIQSMENTSVRKSELKRLGVFAGDVDMMHNFMVQSYAAGHYIAALRYNEQLRDVFSKMRSEAFDYGSSDPKQARYFFNSIRERHLADMDFQPMEIIDTIKKAVSFWFLNLSPRYKLINMTQTEMLTIPALAGPYGYDNAWKELIKAYGEMSAGREGTASVLDPYQLDKFPADVREGLKELAARDKIDVGIQAEANEFRSLRADATSNSLTRAFEAMRGLDQRLEQRNRILTAITALRLARKGNPSMGVKPMKLAEAVDYADMILRRTQGNPSAFNEQMVMRTPVGKIAGHLRKFQMMTIGTMWDYMRRTTSDDPVARKIAARQLAYTTLHSIFIGGARGIPGIATLAFIINVGASIAGKFDDEDDDEVPFDFDKRVREAAGDFAELLFEHTEDAKKAAQVIVNGFPALAGVDVANNMSLGQMYSLFPTIDLELSGDGLTKAAFALFAGAPGGAVAKEFNAWKTWQDTGDWFKALGQGLPAGPADILKAIDEGQRGVRTTGGDTLVKPDEIGVWRSFVRGLGFQPVEETERRARQTQQFDKTQFYKNRTKKLLRKYREAERANDKKEMSKLEDAWEKLQSAKEKAGLPSSNFDVLYGTTRDQEAREEATVEGVQYPN